MLTDWHLCTRHLQLPDGLPEPSIADEIWVSDATAESRDRY